MNKIISFVMLGSKDLEKSSKFYDTIFTPLEIKKIVTTEKYIGYGDSNKPNEVNFYITKPRDGKPATFGNGTMVTFLGTAGKINENDIGLISACKLYFRGLTATC